MLWGVLPLYRLVLVLFIAAPPPPPPAWSLQSAVLTGRSWTAVGALTPELAGKPLLIRARVHNVRGKGKSAFLVLRQATSTVQVGGYAGVHCVGWLQCRRGLDAALERAAQKSAALQAAGGGPAGSSSSAAGKPDPRRRN